MITNNPLRIVWVFGVAVFLANTVQAGPKIGNCSIFPADNIWNTPIDTLPVDADPVHQTWIDAIGRTTKLHMDFAAGLYRKKSIGIPFNQVAGSTLPTCSSFSFRYAKESDQGGVGCALDGLSLPPRGYAIPRDPLLEEGGDKHLLSVDTDACTLYEVHNATYKSNKYAGTGGAGATWSLNSNALRPAGWTSADAAGLPILPGLVRYEEAASGSINHAIRFTVPLTDGTYMWPARHKTATTYVPGLGKPVPPPMGARFRLKKSFVPSLALSQDTKTRAIIQAMQTYGIINADNGSPWFISGEPNANWDDTLLRALGDSLTGNDFEPVDTRCMMVSSSSGQANPAQCTTALAVKATRVAPLCSYVVTPEVTSFANTGGESIVTVTAASVFCPWTAQSNGVPWITMVGGVNAGSQTLSYKVERNDTGVFRTGSLSIAGKTVVISQAN